MHCRRLLRVIVSAPAGISEDVITSLATESKVALLSAVRFEKAVNGAGKETLSDSDQKANRRGGNGEIYRPRPSLRIQSGQGITSSNGRAGESGPQQHPASSSGNIEAIPPAGLPQMRGTLHAVGIRDARPFPD